MKEFSKLLKAIADEKRLRIIKLLEKNKMCVCELASLLNISQPAVSKHLKKLLHVGIISSEKDGFWTNYFLSPKNMQIKKVLTLLKNELNQSEILLKDLDLLKTIDRHKICCKK